MKKFLSIFVVVIMLCLTACGSKAPEVTTDSAKEDSATEQQVTTGKDENNTTAATTETNTKKDETETVKETVLPLAEESTEFSFLSGAGGWSTEMTLNKDGSFTGTYHDSELGSTGEGYPNGSIYVCEFSGKFENFEKINEYSYKMTLTEIKTEKEAGEEWIEDEILYIASTPYGLTDSSNEKTATEFILYLPEAPVDQLAEDFLTWWPYRTDAKTTLSCYGILNVATNDGFFTAE